MVSVAQLRKQIEGMSIPPVTKANTLKVMALAEEEIKKVAQTKVKTVKRPTASLISLSEWELKRGKPLAMPDVSNWVKSKRFCPVLVAELIEEFRLEMVSKDKRYADFVATFQVYVNKGYLSKNPYQLALERSPHKPQGGVQTYRREVNL